MEERRRFDRIDDSVSMTYKIIEQDELNDVLTRLEKTAGRRQKLLAAVAELDSKISTMLPSVEERLPELASIMDLMNRRIHLLSLMAGDETADLIIEDGLLPAQKISLSAGGASFHAPQSVRIHNYLEITLTLFPDYYFVKVIARVVGCRDALPSASEFNKLVAVDFIYLLEHDRQYIISHVLKNRSNQTIESSDS